VVTEDDLERGLHLVGCEDCSEVIWVGYETVKEVDEGNTGQQETR
jgi:diphthamide biosynthesis protein 4